MARSSGRQVWVGTCATVSRSLPVNDEEADRSVPWGFRKTLVYIHERYTKDTHVPIWITENGFPVDGEADMSLDKAVDDTPRQEYYAGYIAAMLQAMREDGVKVGGYMAWSLLE